MNSIYITKTIPVTGMSCGGCVAKVEKTLNALSFVKEAKVNFSNHTLTVSYLKDTEISDLKDSINVLGFDIIIEDNTAKADEKHKFELEKQLKEIKNRALWTGILSLPVFVFGMFLGSWEPGKWISLVLSAVVIFWFGKPYFKSTWKQLKNQSANMDTLVALSTSIAFIFSTTNLLFPDFWINRGLEPHVYFEAAALIITFISLGKWLEEKAKANTNSALQALIELQPKQVICIENGMEKTMAISDVYEGMTLKIKPGEHIAVDGTLIEGYSFVNESLLTGESIAVEKTKGDVVFSGTINQKGSFRMIAKSRGNNSRLSQIIEMVKQAQGSKAPVQKLVDKIASIFVPTIMVLSVLTFVLWMIFGGMPYINHALLSAVSVLVIACPCALGLATPTAIMVGMAKGAEHQILIRDAQSLEIGSKVDTIIFDKTGTLTEGKPKVTDRFILDETLFFRFQNTLYGLEKESSHPLSEAILENLTKPSSCCVPKLENFETVVGQGIKAGLNSDLFFVGNKKLLLENGVDIHPKFLEKEKEYISEAKTLVYFSTKDCVVALFAVEDQLKDSSQEGVRILKNNALDIHILSGDQKTVVEKMASVCGINHYKWEQSPEEKAAYIKALQAKGKIVAMVGDGINDSQALATADLSIAMGNGSDIAMDVAQMTLLNHKLTQINKALRLSKLTVDGIRQNLFWAFIYNLVGIPIAAGALYYFTGYLLSPMVASLAMALSSVSVVLNSLRLKGKTL